MAIKLNKTVGNLEIVLRRDDALDVSDDQYEAYVQSGLDESRLKFVEGKQPTRFVMKKTLSYDEQQTVLSQQIQFKPGAGGKMEQHVNIGFVLDEVRSSLIDIKNPEDLARDQWIEFKRDADGKCQKQLIQELHSAGIVLDLYGVRASVLTAQTAEMDVLKKK